MQVLDESSGEIVYTLRLSVSVNDNSFTPQVFKAGLYTVKVTKLDQGYEKIYQHRKAVREP